jgi:hypothetical protein
MGGMNIASAPLGALLLEVLPMQSILAIDFGTALLAILPLIFIAVPQPQVSQQAGAEAKPSVWQDLKGGLSYVKGWPGLVMIMVMAYHLIQRNEPYRELGGNYFDNRRPEATAKRLVKRLEQLGFSVALQQLASIPA